MQSDSPAAANRRGILAMTAAMACFVANDTLIKYASQSLPAAQLIFVRGVFASVLLFGVLQAMGAGGRLRAVLERRVLLRAAFDAFATVSYLVSLFHLPIATATAIIMATPLVITLIAVGMLGEHVSRARWLAIAIGFSGVLMIVQPTGDGFNAYALLCLAGTLLHAGRDLTTRTIDRAIPSIVITFSTAVAVTLLAGAGLVVGPWQPMTLQQLGLLATASVFLSAGYYLLTTSMRSGDMSVVAPFRYAGLLFALVLGYAVWGDVPNALAWAGIALLVGAGLQVLHDERSRRRAALGAASD